MKYGNTIISIIFYKMVLIYGHYLQKYYSKLYNFIENVREMLCIWQNVLHLT